jgi:hypothetical protein
MSAGKLVFSQVIDHLPLHTFRQCVKRYQGNHKVKSFSCLDQLLCMAFAQLTYRESLRDIEACLRAQSHKLYHMGIRSQVSRNTLANANKVRDWRIDADLAHSLIPVARQLYQNEDFGAELDQTVYALDSTTIDLCLMLFSWAEFRQTKKVPSSYIHKKVNSAHRQGKHSEKGFPISFKQGCPQGQPCLTSGTFQRRRTHIQVFFNFTF